MTPRPSRRWCRTALAVALGWIVAAAPLAAAAEGASAPGATLGVDEVVELYVRANQNVRNLEQQAEASRLEYRRLTAVASSPTLSVSGDVLATPPSGANNPGEFSSASSGTLAFRWSPAVGFSIAGDVGLNQTQLKEARDSASLQASWSLWPPPSLQDNWIQREDVRLKVLQDEHAVHQARTAARTDARALYTRVQVAAARVALRQEEVSYAQQRLAQALARRQAGLAGDDAVLEARKAAQQAVSSLQQALSTLATQEQSLGVPAARLAPLPQGDALIALAFERADAASKAVSPAPTAAPDEHGVVWQALPLPEGLKERALAQAPEIRLAESRLALAERRLQAVRSGWVTVEATGGVTSQREQNGPTWDNPRWSVGLTAQLSVLDGGKRQVDEASALLSVEQARRALEDARQAVVSDLVTRWNAYASAGLNLAAARAALEQADFAYRAASARLERGSASQAEVDQARRSACDAALDLIEAAANLEAEYGRLIARIGEGP